LGRKAREFQGNVNETGTAVSFSLDKIIKGFFPGYLTSSFIPSLITMTQQSYLPV
jgi:hypothetical protein